MYSLISEDLNYLQSQGKKLFIQLQDATFRNQNRGVPEDLQTQEYDGRVIPQRDDSGSPEGWTAKRWNRKVQQKFASLLNALGKSGALFQPGRITLFYIRTIK